jgi:tetratricopeptide (TPR) repeat protein
MLDPTIFAVPMLGATALILLSAFSSPQLVIDAIPVPNDLNDRGYSSAVIGRMLTDELRSLNAAAQRELNGVRVYGTNLDNSLSDLSQYFGFASVTNDVRNIMVGIPYYVRAEIVEDDDKTYHFEGRIFRSGKLAVQVVRAELTPGLKPAIPDAVDGAALRPLMHEAAVAILTSINPYVVAVHLANIELGRKQWDFPLTTDYLDRMLDNPDPQDDYLAYELLGRVHFWRVEGNANLTPEQVRTELQEASRVLRKSLVKDPDFFFANLTLARVEAMLGQVPESDQHFAAAVAEQPDNAMARIAWGKALARESRVRDAIFQYVAAVELERDNADIRLALAELYEKAGRPDAARAQVEAAYHLDPRDEIETRWMQ